MSYYSQLFKIYRQATTWEEFLNAVSRGPGKWTLLQALEAGYRFRIHTDLCAKYHIPSEEADVLLNRYSQLITAKPTHASVQELAIQLGHIINTANILRGYFRYAYWTAVDDPDVIFTILDEQLTELGAGTPTRDECARSYTLVTGKHINPDTVVLSANTADSVADHLAAEMEDLQKRLPRIVETDSNKAFEVLRELEELDELHTQLTGKSVLDLRTIVTMRESLREEQNRGGSNVSTDTKA